MFSSFFQLGGVLVSAIPTKEDGTFDLEILESKIRLPSEDSHEPITRLICLENTHNRCGGKVLPVSYIEKVIKHNAQQYWYIKIRDPVP